MSRFLYAVPASRVGTRLFRDREISPLARLAYHAAVLRLLQLETPALATPESAPERVLRFSSEALAVWAEFHDATEREFGAGGALEALADWGGKLAGNVARLAGLFHAVAHPVKPWERPIEPETVTAAVALGAYLKPHARAAYQLLGADAALALALRALEAIERNGWRELSERDLYRALGETRRSLEPPPSPSSSSAGTCAASSPNPARPAPKASRPHPDTSSGPECSEDPFLSTDS